MPTAAPIRTGRRRYPTTRAEHARALHVARLKRRRQRRHPVQPPRVVLLGDTRQFKQAMAGIAQTMNEMAKGFSKAAEAAVGALQPLAEYVSTVRMGAIDDLRPYCVADGCSEPAVGERITGMIGEDEVVDLVCYEHLDTP